MALQRGWQTTPAAAHGSIVNARGEHPNRKLTVQARFSYTGAATADDGLDERAFGSCYYCKTRRTEQTPAMNDQLHCFARGHHPDGQPIRTFAIGPREWAPACRGGFTTSVGIGFNGAFSICNDKISLYEDDCHDDC